MSLHTTDLIFLGLQFAILASLLLLWRGEWQVIRRRAIWIAATLAVIQLLYIAAQTIIRIQSLTDIGTLSPFRHVVLNGAIQSITTILVYWAGGVAMLWILSRLWQAGDTGRVDSREILAVTLASVVVGWPAVLIFLAIVFVMSVLGLVTLILLKRRTLESRLVIAPFIVPAAMLTLIFRPELLDLTGLLVIRV